MAPGRAAQRERAVLPHRLAAPNQVAAGEVARGEIVVAGDGDERPAEAPGHVLDEAGLAAAGRALEHDRQGRRAWHVSKTATSSPTRQVERLRSARRVADRRRSRGARRSARPSARRRLMAPGRARARPLGRAASAGRRARKKKSQRKSATPRMNSMPVAEQHQEVHLDLELGLEVAEAEDALEIGLRDSRRRERHRHAEHAADLQPERPQPGRRLALAIPGMAGESPAARR